MATGVQEVPITKALALLVMAQRIADQTPAYFIAAGPGGGNLRSNAFMDQLRSIAKQTFGRDYSEAKLCGDNKLAMDFYFPDEETVVEIAGLLSGLNSEYEKDIFKCLLARDNGCKIRQLFFIAKPGAAKIFAAPGRTAIAQFVLKHFEIEICLEELVNSAIA
jgi:hypothetical protein